MLMRSNYVLMTLARTLVMTLETQNREQMYKAFVPHQISQLLRFLNLSNWSVNLSQKRGNLSN